MQLAEHGMVLVEPVGAANSYRLNREHFLVGPALELLGSIDRLEAALGAGLRGWAVPSAGCALFGSAARRDGSTQSDLDVLVLRPVGVGVDDPIWRSQLDDLASQAHRWTGNVLSWVEFDTRTFARMISATDPLVSELRRDAKWLIEPSPTIATALSAVPRSA
jgi:hypothetical protein